MAGGDYTLPSVCLVTISNVIKLV